MNFLLSRGVRFIEYFVVKNIESINKFEIINACLLLNEEKPISYLNSGEKMLSELHIFLSETKKKYFLFLSVTIEIAFNLV